MVVPLMVRRHPVAAAFVSEPRVPFVCAIDLAQTLTSSDLPAPGYLVDDDADQ